ncbi:MAG: DUF523 domain-containing protein [Syntrophomonadaceae bacterium]|nr:DUF523 domain-containing protein [Syntrophomonadaceae bacterium]
MLMVSACLAGINCKYCGGNNYSPELTEYLHSTPHILVCPEIMGGLSTPRLPAEISGGDGLNIIKGDARVLDSQGTDVTSQFLNGARACAELARLNKVTRAILKEKSPSCGGSIIYDGSFSGHTVAGLGVTAALLKEYGIEIITV